MTRDEASAEAIRLKKFFRIVGVVRYPNGKLQERQWQSLIT